jgi:hypothetical protein
MTDRSRNSSRARGRVPECCGVIVGDAEVARLMDADPEKAAALLRRFPDAHGLFEEHQALAGQVVLADEIKRYLMNQRKLTDPRAVVAAMQRRFPRVYSAKVAESTRALLDRRMMFHQHDGLYRMIAAADDDRRGGDLLWLSRARSEGITPIPYLNDARATTAQGRPGPQAAPRKGDHWTSWFSKLGTDARYCHLRVTLEPAEPERYRPMTLGVLLHAGQEPGWLVYLLTRVQAPVAEALMRRGWSAWMPHDRPGSRYQEHTASPRYLSDELNEVVVGAHLRSVADVWAEVTAVATGPFTMENLDRVDVAWEPIDEEERKEIERRRRILERAFSWVRHGAGGSSSGSGYPQFEELELHGNCIVCGRDLLDEGSVEQQIGPVCRGRVLVQLADAPELSTVWGSPEELLDRMARSDYRVPLSYWAYARPLDPSVLTRA